MIYFISDTHFGHKNIIEYTSRPYLNVHEMNVALTENWNSVVTANDTIYHLGDFAFKSKAKIKDLLRKLNGNIIFIRGNHDHRELTSACNELDIPIYDYLKIKIEDDEIGIQKLILFHYPMITWDEKERGSWQLFGHCHNSLPRERLHPSQMDVGVENINYTPILYEEVRIVITKQNLNERRK